MIDMSVDERVTSSEHTNKQAQQLLTLVQYMPPAEAEQVAQALRLAQDTCGGVRGERPVPPLEHALAVATILAEIMHIDAVGVAAGLVFEAVDSDLLPLERLETTLGAPLAGRLGMSLVEGELEDLAFATLEPEKYAWVRSQVEAESRQWRSYVDRVCTILGEEMAKLGLKAEVSGRVKHLYSFYKKLQRNAGDVERLEDLRAAADFSQIHDLVAFRIIVESTPDCYLALGHVHSLWKPKDGRIKDFIANPKSNGYRALHTTAFCLDDRLVEIQIRTRDMDAMAEDDVAMHWHYKEVGDPASASAKGFPYLLRPNADLQL